MKINDIIKSESLNRPLSLIIVLLTCLFVIALHSVNLNADPPDSFILDDIGLRVDEGYKTLAARNLVLFGSEKWSNADEYEGWFRGSPLTQTLLYGSFSIFGANIIVARATALFYFFLLILIVLWAYRGTCGREKFYLLAALVATEPFLFFFSRAALFEVALAAAVTACLAYVKRTGDDKPILAAIVSIILCFASAVLIKKSALLYFSPIIVAMILFISIKYSSKRLILFITSLAILAGISIIMSGMLSQRLYFPSVENFLVQVTTNPLAINSPWLTCAAWFCVYSIFRTKDFKKYNDALLVSACFVIVLVPIMLGFMSYAPPRYYVAMIPGFIFLVAYWFNKDYLKDKYSEKVSKFRISKISVCSLAYALYILLFAIANDVLPLTPIPQGDTPGISEISAVRYLLPLSLLLAITYSVISVKYRFLHNKALKTVIYSMLLISVSSGTFKASEVWINPSYSTSAVRIKLSEIVKDGETIIGDFAPFFALGTGIPAVYATTGLNNGSIILRICPKYYLFSGTKGDQNTFDSFKPYVRHGAVNEIPLGEYAGKEITLIPLNINGFNCR